MTLSVGWIRRFIVFHGKRHPRDLGEPEVTAFISSLAERDVSASTQNQALSWVKDLSFDRGELTHPGICKRYTAGVV